MYQLKSTPEDFIVKERSTVELGEGVFTHFLLKKKNYTTPKALEKIARAIHVLPKEIFIAGNKDKVAVTEQVCSVRGKEEALKGLLLDDITITVLGRGPEPVSLGKLAGNEFTIVVRNVEKQPKEITRFINYFGEQRFLDKNIDVGRAIIKKDWKTACSLVGVMNVNELHQIQWTILRLYVHAYQSYLWNEVVKTLVEEGKEKQFVPLVGFGTHFKDRDVQKTYEALMEKEDITTRSFIIREIPDLSQEGDERAMYVEAKDLHIHYQEKVLTLSFFLPKGCYATVFIEQLLA
tara:strand:+ start:881 stop:1756 length:876 start_codon:yes stop_codon:yes gene_type:complete